MFRKFQTLVPDGKYLKHVYDVPKEAGFYVLKYKEGHEERVYLDTPKHHHSEVYSYPATYFNYRDKPDCGMDMGQYVWVNSYTTHGPVEWRRMEPKEALEFSCALFRFGRPSWAHPHGRKPLTLADVTPAEVA
jgi:hypothetical protein